MKRYLITIGTATVDNVETLAEVLDVLEQIGTMGGHFAKVYDYQTNRKYTGADVRMGRM